jgi:hypothetical protein
MEATAPASDGRFQLWLSIAIIVCLGVAAYFGYRMVTRDRSADQAKALAQTFIQSSPVLQTDLGKVTGMKELTERRLPGASPLWAVNYDVTGHRGSGDVEMELRESQGLWTVPSAKLDVDHHAPVNLR